MERPLLRSRSAGQSQILPPVTARQTSGLADGKRCNPDPTAWSLFLEQLMTFGFTTVLFRLSKFSSFTLSNPNLIVALKKAVKPSFSNLFLGTNYQLQVSTDLNTWTNNDSPFTPTNTTMPYPQYFDVGSWNQLFFRLQVAP